MKERETVRGIWDEVAATAIGGQGWARSFMEKGHMADLTR
jgi:hypothetical protein